MHFFSGRPRAETKRGVSVLSSIEEAPSAFCGLVCWWQTGHLALNYYVCLSVCIAVEAQREI